MRTVLWLATSLCVGDGQLGRKSLAGSAEARIVPKVYRIRCSDVLSRYAIELISSKRDGLGAVISSLIT
jgi:hypothetical protein